MRHFKKQSNKTMCPTTALTLDGKCTLEIPSKSMQEIDYLCSTISSVEWAGVLFFKIREGKIEEQNMVMEVVEVYPMDKGSSAATGYKFTPDVGKRHAELIKEHKSMVKIGMIHSHHNMDSYFSATDMEELNENSENHSWYLSLIVNNAGKYVAKIGYRTEAVISKTIRGPIPIEPIIEASVMFLHFDVDVVKTKFDSIMPTSWLNKLKEVVSPKYGIGGSGLGHSWGSDWDAEWEKNKVNHVTKNKNIVDEPEVWFPALIPEKQKEYDNFSEDLRKEVKCVMNTIITEKLEGKLSEFAMDNAYFAYGISMIEMASQRVAVAQRQDYIDERIAECYWPEVIKIAMLQNDVKSDILQIMTCMIAGFQKAAGLFQGQHLKRVANEIVQTLTDNIIEIEEGHIS